MAFANSLRHLKTVVLWSRETDQIIAVAFGLLCCFAFAAGVGCIIPAPVDDGQMRLINASITMSLLAFVWSGFRLIRPFQPSHLWMIGEWIVVPLFWTVLVIALAVWFGHLQPDFDWSTAKWTIIL